MIRLFLNRLKGLVYKTEKYFMKLELLCFIKWFIFRDEEKRKIFLRKNWRAMEESILSDFVKMQLFDFFIHERHDVKLIINTWSELFYSRSLV